MVPLQAPQKVTVGLDLTVEKLHLDEPDDTLGILAHIKVYMNPNTRIDIPCHCYYDL